MAARPGARSLGGVGLLGGVGGGLNALLCYLKWPVPAADDLTFAAWIIPAGLAHGALLALGIVAGDAVLAKRALPARLLLIAFGSWIVGWLSFIPLHLEILFQPVGVEPFFAAGDRGELLILKVLWPFQHDIETLWIPFLDFGAVATVSWALRWLVLPRLVKAPAAPRSWRLPAVWIAAGVLGSLWWWISYNPWWFSLLHGTIWGALVGLGVWKSQQRLPA